MNKEKIFYETKHSIIIIFIFFITLRLKPLQRPIYGNEQKKWLYRFMKHKYFRYFLNLYHVVVFIVKEFASAIAQNKNYIKSCNGEESNN